MAEAPSIAELLARLEAEIVGVVTGLVADRRRQGLELPEGEEERLARDLQRRLHKPLSQGLLDAYGTDRYVEIRVVPPRVRVALEDFDGPSQTTLDAASEEELPTQKLPAQKR